MPNPNHILLVDDCEDLRKSLATLLERAGYAVTEARNGDVAEFMSLLADFDLVISDIVMPEIDGISMAKFIHQHSRVPIILMTGIPDEATLDRTRDAEPVCVVTKPFEPAKLLAAVKKALGGS